MYILHAATCNTYNRLWKASVLICSAGWGVTEVSSNSSGGYWIVVFFPFRQFVIMFLQFWNELISYQYRLHWHFGYHIYNKTYSKKSCELLKRTVSGNIRGVKLFGYEENTSRQYLHLYALRLGHLNMYLISKKPSKVWIACVVCEWPQISKFSDTGSLVVPFRTLRYNIDWIKDVYTDMRWVVGQLKSADQWPYYIFSMGRCEQNLYK